MSGTVPGPGTGISLEFDKGTEGYSLRLQLHSLCDLLLLGNPYPSDRGSPFPD